jgi:hypothetical protein
MIDNPAEQRSHAGLAGKNGQLKMSDFEKPKS